jgi:hypothetical protein
MRRCLPLIAILVILALPANALTSYHVLVARLTHDAKRSDSISVTALGKAGSGSRTVWLVRVAAPSVRESETVRILVLCRQHGDEPASTEAALDFLDRVVANTAPGLPDDLTRVTLYIVPMVNPDGADALTRLNAKGVNLNRDWSVFAAPETRAVMRASMAIRPALVLDMHSWDPTDPYESTCIESPRQTDAVASSAAARETIALSARVLSQMHDASGLDIAGTSFGSGADRQLCHRYFLLTRHTPALLFETSPAPTGSGQELVKRADLARALLTATIGTIASDPVLAAKLRSGASSAHVESEIAALFAASPLNHPTARAPQAPPRPRPWLSRVPKPVWYALGLYALAALLITICKPKPVPTPVLRLAAGSVASAPRDPAVTHAVVMRLEQPQPHPELTRGRR